MSFVRTRRISFCRLLRKTLSPKTPKLGQDRSKSIPFSHGIIYSVFVMDTYVLRARNCSFKRFCVLDPNLKKRT